MFLEGITGVGVTPEQGVILVMKERLVEQELAISIVGVKRDYSDFVKWFKRVHSLRCQNVEMCKKRGLSLGANLIYASVRRGVRDDMKRLEARELELRRSMEQVRKEKTALQEDMGRWGPLAEFRRAERELDEEGEEAVVAALIDEPEILLRTARRTAIANRLAQIGQAVEVNRRDAEAARLGREEIGIFRDMVAARCNEYSISQKFGSAAGSSRV
mmetsp:Transcript_16397/g.32640  ORF Transcript_16397/g.32640 Transcript_16397/m.32640 type:complete len:216 (-) Transcript_16397:1203-1850(-)